MVKQCKSSSTVRNDEGETALKANEVIIETTPACLFPPRLENYDIDPLERLCFRSSCGWQIDERVCARDKARFRMSNTLPVVRCVATNTVPISRL